MHQTKKGMLIGALLYFFISGFLLFWPVFLGNLTDEHWRECATSLYKAEPNTDPGNIDYSSCGEKKEKTRDFLLFLEHNFLKQGEMIPFGVVFFNILWFSLFVGIGAVAGKFFKKRNQSV